MKKTILLPGKLCLLILVVLSSQAIVAQQLIKDIKIGADSSSPAHLTVFNGKLYFSAEDSTHGRELWVTDGTTTGTKFLYEARVGKDASAPTELRAFKNHLYFTAQSSNSSFSRKLYRTDGVNGDNIDAFWPSAKVSSTEIVEVSGDYIYFNGYNGDIGDEIFVSDGTDGGTDGKDVYPFKTFGGTPRSSTPGDFTDAGGGILFFNADYLTRGRDPYYINNSDYEGVVDVNQNLGNSEARDFTKMGDYVYFSATRDKKTSINGPDNDEGNELWRVKIGSGLPRIVKNIHTGAYNDANPRNLFNWGDSIILFSANDGNGAVLWKTDGSEAGTVKVNSSVSSPKWFVSFKNEIYFVSQNRLWKTDGTFNGTVEVDNSVNITSPFTKINNRLYFTSSDTIYGEELWETDGSKQGTKLVKDIIEGTASSSPKNLTVFNNSLYFTATDSVKGIELFSYTDTCNAYAGGLNFSGNVGLCTDDSIQLKANSFNTAAVFSWWYNGSIVATNVDSLNANKEGTYRLITNNGNGCIDTSVAVIVNWFIKPSNKILTPKGNSMCKGDMDLIELVPETSTSSYQYQWIENGVEMNNVRDTAIKTNRTSNFQVRISNGGCTITTDTVFTFLYELPKTNTSNTINLCPGSSVTLDPGNFKSYLWAIDNDTSATKTVSVANNYKVTVTDDNGCSNTGTFIVAGRPKPNVTLTKYGNTFEATSDAGNFYRWLRNGVIINGATQSTFSPTQNGDYAVVATNQFGCADTTAAQSFVLSINGIQQIISKVYPNPVTDVFTVELENADKAVITITDIQGKHIYTQQIENKEVVNVSNLALGVYYLEIRTNNELKTIKLLKQ